MAGAERYKGKLQPELGFINPLPQDAGGLKHHYASGPQDEVLFGLRVAAAPGILATDTEFAKTTDQDVFFLGQGIFHNIQNAFYGAASFLLAQPDLEINVINNLFFGQGHGRNSFLLPEGKSEPAI
jgi:hypothetical protein